MKFLKKTPDKRESSLSLCKSHALLITVSSILLEGDNLSLLQIANSIELRMFISHIAEVTSSTPSQRRSIGISLINKIRM